MTEKVYDSYHWLSLKFRGQNYNQEQNLNFTQDVLQEMGFEFQKATFRRSLKNWLFSNRRLCRWLSCISMKLGTFV